jgi:hypothetical protein
MIPVVISSIKLFAFDNVSGITAAYCLPATLKQFINNQSVVAFNPF